MFLVDPANVYSRDATLAGMPAWWRSFIFQILNGRQVCVYMYLIMLMGEDTVCWPTTRQIADDLGLLSPTMVFDAIKALEEYGFLLRSRKGFAGRGTRRNVYQRPSVAYTLLQLLRHDGIKKTIRFVPERMRVFNDGLRQILGRRYHRYAAASPDEKREVLVGLLEDVLYETAAPEACAIPAP